MAETAKHPKIENAQQCAYTMSKFTPQSRKIFVEKIRSTHPDCRGWSAAKTNRWIDQYIKDNLGGDRT